MKHRFSAAIDRATLRGDAMVGLLAALLVLPQAIAFATLAGLPPQYGLYTAVVPCIVAALAGSSRLVLSGPTNAISLALLAMVAPLAAAGSALYIELVLAVTLLVGALQLALGLLRLGGVANFISPSALKGFTTGAALLIAWHALRQVLGTDATAPNPAAIGVAAAAIGIALIARLLAPRSSLPMLLGLAAATLLAWLLGRFGSSNAPVATIGAIPSALPPLHLPSIEWSLLPDLLGKAGAITIVALGQTIAIAKAVAARTGGALDANREFVGQGLSNLAGGLFSSYVSCGSLNRTLPVVEAGAKTRAVAVFSSLWLIALVALAAPLLAAIPVAAIGALLLLVAWSLFDLREWRRLARLQRTEFVIAAVTALATVSLRIEIAILLGTLLSLVAHLYVTSHPAMRSMGFDSTDRERKFVVVDEPRPGLLRECPQLKLLRMEGSVYFGAVAHVGERLRALRETREPPPQKHLLVMAKSMNFIDLAGADLWRDELRARRAIGGDLYFHRPRPQVIEMWQRTGFIDELGADHIFPDKRSAIAAIVPKLDQSICARCEVKLFFESPGASADRR